MVHIRRYSDCCSSPHHTLLLPPPHTPPPPPHTSPPPTTHSSPHHTLRSHTCAPPSELIHPNFQVCEDQPQSTGVATGGATGPLDHPNFKAAEVTRPHLTSCWTKYTLPTGERTRLFGLGLTLLISIPASLPPLLPLSLFPPSPPSPPSSPPSPPSSFPPLLPPSLPSFLPPSPSIHSMVQLLQC